MLELSYGLLFVALFGIILFYFNAGMKTLNLTSNVRFKKIGLVVAITSVWLTYVILISRSGFLLETSLPPRIVLSFLAPLFLFTGIFLYSYRNHPLMKAIPIHIPIAYQSFRTLIEVLFYFTFLAGILPEIVTFGGYNYDVLLGLSAPFAAWFAYKNPNAKKLLIAWNIIGIIIVGIAAFTFITTFYFPSFWGFDEPLATKFIRFPFLLLPSFFMPSAIFMHVLSIFQLTRKD